MRGLFFNLIGVIKDAYSLPQETRRILRDNQSIQVMRDGRDREKWIARVTFLRKEDGSFISPATALTEKDMDYFLIQVVNTYKGSAIIVETGAKDKPKDIWVDERGIESCEIGGGAGTLIRVHNNGQTEILRISSSVTNNKRGIEIFSLFEGNLPFEDEAVLKVMISDKEVLSLFEKDIKYLHNSLNKPRERFEKGNLNLSQAKARLIQSQDNTPKKVEPQKPASPPEPETAPESEEVEPKPKKEKSVKKTAVEKTDKKKASARVKRAKVEDEEKEAKKEILEAEKTGGKVSSLAELSKIVPKK